MKTQISRFLFFVWSVSFVDAFIARCLDKKASFTRLNMAAEQTFEMGVELPPSGSGLTAQMKFASVLEEKSEIVEVRYSIPFGLDVAPQKGFAVCTKDGAGGEKVGDILRYTSQWTLGLPRGEGLVASASAFSGGVSWQCTMFDVMKASKWEAVVEALTSNVPVRTDEVVLIFERPIADN